MQNNEYCFFSEVRRTKSKTSPKNDQLRIVQIGLPTSATIFCAIRLRETILLHLTKICPKYYSKHPPKRANQELRKMAFQGFQPCFIFLPYEIKSAA